MILKNLSLGVLHLLPQISMFCALSIINIFFKNASYGKLSKELKNIIKI